MSSSEERPENLYRIDVVSSTIPVQCNHSYVSPHKYHYVEGRTPFWRAFRNYLSVNPEISSGLPDPRHVSTRFGRRQLASLPGIGYDRQERGLITIASSRLDSAPRPGPWLTYREGCNHAFPSLGHCFKSVPQPVSQAPEIPGNHGFPLLPATASDRSPPSVATLLAEISVASTLLWT